LEVSQSLEYEIEITNWKPLTRDYVKLILSVEISLKTFQFLSRLSLNINKPHQKGKTIIIMCIENIDDVIVIGNQYHPSVCDIVREEATSSLPNVVIAKFNSEFYVSCILRR